MLQVPSVPKEGRIPEEINLAPHKEVSRTIVAKHPDQAAARRPDHVLRAEVKAAHVRKAIIKADHVRKVVIKVERVLRAATTKAGPVRRASRVEPEADSQELIAITIIATARTAVPETTITIVQTPSVLMTTVREDSVATIAVERTTAAGINIISSRLVRKSTTRRRKLSSVAT